MALDHSVWFIAKTTKKSPDLFSLYSQEEHFFFENYLRKKILTKPVTH